MPTYVQVAVNVPQVVGPFDYHLPTELEGKVEAGSLVEVPFGAQTVQGIVLRMVSEPQVPETRPVDCLVDPLPVLKASQLVLAHWLAENTLSSLAACLELMLPPGLSQHAEQVVSLTSAQPPTDGLAPLAVRLLALLAERGDLRSGQLDAAFPRQNWRLAVQNLVRRGLVTAHTRLPPPTVQPRRVRSVQLAGSPEAVSAYLEQANRSGKDAPHRRAAILEFLRREPWPVALAWITAQTGGKSEDVRKLAEEGLVVYSESEIWRDPLENFTFVPDEPLILTDDQQAAYNIVQASLQAAARGETVRPILLHGVTGSGKTEIYLQAVAETLRLGRHAIILVPEISLTPQTVRRFLCRFPGQVGVLHSRLSPGERYDTWRRARAGSLPVIVGPRSALFAPLADLGLIVVDECHADSYSQDDIPPFYNAVPTAVEYAQIARAVIVLGSATPDLTQNYQAAQGRWQKVSLPDRLLAHRQAVEQQAAHLGLSLPPLNSQGQTTTLDLPKVSIVDMRQELKAGNRSIFSQELQDALGQVMRSGQQAILFLNRRGTATYVFCRDCGYALRCPRCDRPLTFHTSANMLTCHACGYTRQMPKRCPQCSSTQIRQFGTGTEKVESEVQSLLPGVRTLRWDAETTHQKNVHEVILAHFSAHRADVLVGTQMLAKSLDLPLVTLVGVVLAEVSLNLPDFRASERTFQVLTQVAGRAGRSPLGGRVILQTFQPEHYAIQAAARHDYAGFYQQEMIYRRRLGYPPFYRLVRLEYRSNDDDQARQAAEALAGQLLAWIKAGEQRATSLIGPTPCFFARLNGLYRWQIILRGPNPADLLRGRPLANWRVQVDPPDLL